ncbi:MAG: glycosyltransferase [Candidatus Dormibacteria bacterium]
MTVTFKLVTAHDDSDEMAVIDSPRDAELTGRTERRRASCDLAVLVHEFPKLSETFVLSDLLALEASGVRLHVFSLRQPQAALAQEDVSRLQARVEYLPEVQGRQFGPLIRATQAALLLRNPRVFAQGLAEIYASPDFSRLRLKQALMLARRLDRLGSPPLYVHFAHRPGTVGRFAALMLGIPFAISAHAVDIWTTAPKELRVKVRDAEVVLCCYREAQEYLAGLASSHTPVELAYHGVELPPVIVRRERTPLVLLSVGRLIEKKGFDTLLRAARLVADREFDFRLAIAGDGPLWATLQRLVNELELGEYVRFLGPLNQHELERYFAEAGAFVLPCQIAADGNRDGLPNTLLEAMARGLPVISTTLESVREAIPDDRCGLLVAPHDHVALAEAMARVLEDAALRERLGAAARRRVAETFDRELYRGRVFDVLAEAGLVARSAG